RRRTRREASTWFRAGTPPSTWLCQRHHAIERNDLGRLLLSGLDRVVFDRRFPDRVGVVVGQKRPVPFLIPTNHLHGETLRTDPIVEPAKPDFSRRRAGRHLGVVAFA